MRKLKVHFKVEPIASPPMAAGCPHGDLPIISRFIVIRRWSADAPPVIARAPADHRRGTAGASAGNFVNSRANRPVAARSPNGGRPTSAAWFYNLLQGRENRRMTCRCRKIGIGEKSAGHRPIYKACDVGLSWRNVLSWSGGHEFKPRPGWTWCAWYFCPKSYLNQTYIR